MFYTKFSFNFPIFLWLALLSIPYIVFRWYILKQNRLAYSPLQYAPKSNKTLYVTISKLVLEFFVFTTICIGIAGPYQVKEKNLIIEKGIDIALVIDVSASMQAEDFSPNRLESAKKVASEFIKNSASNRIGIYIFAQDVFTQTPLSTDHTVLLDLLDSISFKSIDHSTSGGTAIGDALLAASDSMIKSRMEKRGQAIILITDGENSHGVDPLIAAKYIKDNYINLYIIGMAADTPVAVNVDGKPYITPSGKPLVTSLDDTQLKEIAKQGDGKYYRAKTNSVLSEIFQELQRLEKSEIEIKKMENKIYFAPYLAYPAIVFYLLWFLIEVFLYRRPIR